jgi:hypothetical protein
LALPLYLRRETEVEGGLMLDLAEAFLSKLLFPGCRPSALHTRSAPHVAMVGGEETLREKLREMRVERLNHGGLLVVATDSPLPDDTQATRERFAKLHGALQPAFLSREETPENKRGMLGYFYRERSYMV